MIRPLALAAALVLAPLPALAEPFVDFAGYTWLVRSYGGGPGPNEWREANVFVDEHGLHLTIQQDGGVWTCAEVLMMGDPLGFGTYEFEISGDFETFDSNAVLGLFNYPGSGDVGPDGTNEIDIEIAQWGQPNNRDRLNWNIYPAVEGGKKGNHSIPLPLGPGSSTHQFTWTPERIDYASFQGFVSEGEVVPLGDWTYAPKNAARDIPQAPLVVHMNLWLNQGEAPMSGEPVEVVINDFRFTPG
ncbi:MAG: glycoside hydrolase family 16 protein [Devosia sp.]